MSGSKAPRHGQFTLRQCLVVFAGLAVLFALPASSSAWVFGFATIIFVVAFPAVAVLVVLAAVVSGVCLFSLLIPVTERKVAVAWYAAQLRALLLAALVVCGYIVYFWLTAGQNVNLSQG